jgi:hypothetical protein
VNIPETITLDNLVHTLAESEKLLTEAKSICDKLREFVLENLSILTTIRGSRTQAYLAVLIGTKQPCISALENGNLEYINDVTLVRALKIYIALSLEEDPIVIKRRQLIESLKGVE